MWRRLTSYPPRFPPTHLSQISKGITRCRLLLMVHEGLLAIRITIHYVTIVSTDESITHIQRQRTRMYGGGASEGSAGCCSRTVAERVWRARPGIAGLHVTMTAPPGQLLASQRCHVPPRYLPNPGRDPTAPRQALPAPSQARNVNSKLTSRATLTSQTSKPSLTTYNQNPHNSQEK